VGTRNFQCSSGDFLSIQRSADLSRALSIKSLHTILLPNKQVHENPLTRRFSSERERISTSRRGLLRGTESVPSLVQRERVRWKSVLSASKPADVIISAITRRDETFAEDLIALRKTRTRLCRVSPIRPPSGVGMRFRDGNSLKEFITEIAVPRIRFACLRSEEGHLDCSRISLKRPARPCNFFRIEGMYPCFNIRPKPNVLCHQAATNTSLPARKLIRRRRDLMSRARSKHAERQEERERERGRGSWSILQIMRRLLSQSSLGQ